jgi:hypothetical protein
MKSYLIALIFILLVKAVWSQKEEVPLIYSLKNLVNSLSENMKPYFGIHKESTMEFLTTSEMPRIRVNIGLLVKTTLNSNYTFH